MNFGKPICFHLLLVVALLFSMDSDLEAFSHNPTDGSFTALADQLTVLFSHNPTDGSFTALADQLTVFTNYLNQRFLSY